MNIENYLHTPKIELISFTDDVVTFHSSRQFQELARVRFEVEGHFVKVQIREIHDKGVYVGEVVEGHEYLVTHFGTDAPSFIPKRRAPRVLHRMRIMSQQLPGFQALSLDFSPLGLKVQLEEPVEEGLLVELLIDFDWPGQEPTTAQARVVWCESKLRYHIAGLEFVDLSAITQEFLLAFCLEIETGEVSDVTKAIAHHKELSTRAVTSAQTLERPTGVHSDLSGKIESYSVKGDSFRLTMTEGGKTTTWTFLELFVLRNNQGMCGSEVVEAWEKVDSQELVEARSHRAIPLDYSLEQIKHFQLVNASKAIVLEFVAVPTYHI